MNKIQIRTDDGVCRAYTFGDAGPSLLFFMDGIGIRSALFEMGERMAAGGYRVLLPDLFYRAGEYVAPDPAKLFADEDVRKQHFAKFMATASVANTMKDTKTFLEHLPGKVGVTGYCMGGKMALCAAAYHPDRIVAAAAFHPGGLINDTADSLDKLAPRRSRRGCSSASARWTTRASPTITKAEARGRADRRERAARGDDVPVQARLGAVRHAGARQGRHRSPLRGAVRAAEVGAVKIALAAACILALAAPARADDATDKRIAAAKALLAKQVDLWRHGNGTDHIETFAATMTSDGRLAHNGDWLRPDLMLSPPYNISKLAITTTQVGWSGTWGWIVAEIKLTSRMYAEPAGAGDPNPQPEDQTFHWIELVVADGDAVKGRAIGIYDAKPDSTLFGHYN